MTISLLPEQIHQCGTGVFNALAIALNSNLYNLNSTEDPYKICLNQEADFIKSCYEQMNTRAASLSKGDFALATKFIIKIQNKEHSLAAMEQLVPAIIVDKVGQGNDFSPELKVCMSLPDYLKKACINGIVGGILEFGKPDYEYLEALDFCNYTDLSELDKKQCFKFVASSSYVIYSSDKAKHICDMIDKKYEPICKN
ncbi:hypothetical protein K8Q98_01630 [Candidatus Nomurabacteria bacterium]|nr:hypothetical protein [Candidatus Nomurabacteria bacterium]